MDLLKHYLVDGLLISSFTFLPGQHKRDRRNDNDYNHVSCMGSFGMLVTYQQLDGYQMPYDNLGLSDACFDAVNTTVTSCPAWVGYIGVEYVSWNRNGTDMSLGLSLLISSRSASFDIVPSEQLVALCESTCRSDLARSHLNCMH